MKARMPKRSLFRRIALLLTIPIAPAVGVAVLHPSGPPMQQPALAPGEVRLEQVATWPEKLWIDARTAEAYAEAHIPRALNLNEDAWDAQVPEVLMTWQPGVPVVVYCDSRTCDASHAVARRLREEMGLEEVYVLHGGWETWLGTRGKEE